MLTDGAGDCMKKLRDLIEKVYKTGKLPKCCTITDFHILVSVYNELVMCGHPEFISLSVKNILEKCGVMTAPKGIGWVAIR